MNTKFKVLILAAALSASVSPVIAGECHVSSEGSGPIYTYANFDSSSNDTHDSKVFYGRIVHINYNSDGTIIESIIVQDNRGVRQPLFEIDPCLYEQSNAQKAWIPEVFREGAYIIGKVNIHGASGGSWILDCITFLNWDPIK